MNILITGATGFIGRELGKELVFRGHQIRVMSRDSHRARIHLPFPAEVISGRDGLPARALEGIDAVINLAGEPLTAKRWTKAQKSKIRDSRVKITADLMRLVRNSKVKTVISASAIGFYGDRGDEVLTEESGPGSGFLAEVCRNWEEELFQGAIGMKSAPRSVAIRFGVVLGRSGGALEKLLPLFRRGLGGVVGSGRQYMSWIHIYDLVQMIVFALEDQNVKGILNGVGPEPVDNWEFTRTLAKVVSRPAALPAPAFALRVALGEMAGILTSSQKVLPTRPMDLGFKFQYPGLESALQEINGDLAPGEEEFVSEQFVGLANDDLAFCLNKTWGNNQTFEPTPKLMKFKTIKKHSTWKYSQQLIPLAHGTILRDRVVFRLPVGWLGQLSGGSMITKDVTKIFEDRRQFVDQRCGERRSAAL